MKTSCFCTMPCAYFLEKKTRGLFPSGPLHLNEARCLVNASVYWLHYSRILFELTLNSQAGNSFDFLSVMLVYGLWLKGMSEHSNQDLASISLASWFAPGINFRPASIPGRLLFKEMQYFCIPRSLWCPGILFAILNSILLFFTNISLYSCVCSPSTLARERAYPRNNVYMYFLFTFQC